MGTTTPFPTSKLLQPLHEFLRLEAAGGLILMAAALLALIFANSPLASYYAALVDLPAAIRIGSFGIAKPVLLWINDGPLVGLNRGGVTRPAAYILIGIPLWAAVLKSGVHATLAGVVLAMFIPLRAREEGSTTVSDSLRASAGGNSTVRRCCAASDSP